MNYQIQMPNQFTFEKAVTERYLSSESTAQIHQRAPFKALYGVSATAGSY